jgi:hypothetical protein
MPGPTHTLLLPQDEVQRGMVQSSPPQPDWHLHKSGPTQTPPFSQICVQVAEMARMRLLLVSATYIKLVSVNEVPGLTATPLGLLK